MVFGDINWFDPSTWLWGALLLVILSFIAIHFRIFLGKREPRE